MMEQDEKYIEQIRKLYSTNTKVGFVDEVGRGSIAGLLCAACVVFDHMSFLDSRVDDSKQVNKDKMKNIANDIRKYVLDWNIGVVTIKELNNTRNLEQSTFLAMRRAVLGCQIKPTVVFVDGPRMIPNLNNIKQFAVIDGDAKIYGIACASIIAKDFRDTHMKCLAELHPQYLWAQNAGYGTKDHLEAIREHGLTRYHRLWYKNVKEIKCQKVN